MKLEKISTFQERLLTAMNAKNMRAVDLVKTTGISKQKISQYVNGQFEAKSDGKILLAKALGVNEQWLSGYNVPMNTHDYGDLATPDDLERWDRELNPDEKLAKEVKLIEDVETQWGKPAADMIGLFNSLNDKGQKKAIDNVTDLTMIEQYKRND